MTSTPVASRWREGAGAGARRMGLELRGGRLWVLEQLLVSTTPPGSDPPTRMAAAAAALSLDFRGVEVELEEEQKDEEEEQTPRRPTIIITRHR